MLGLSDGFQGRQVHLTGLNHDSAVVGHKLQSLQEGLRPRDQVQCRLDYHHRYQLIPLHLAPGRCNSLLGENDADSKL
jgi:hypothetical protein